MQNSEKIKRYLADMQLWAADEMKEYAEKSCDPQLKKKYQQITALNRSFYEILATDDKDNKSRSKIVSETDLLLRAYYCQSAVCQGVFAVMVEDERPDRIDEICDRQIMICRELLDEANGRINLINS